MRIRRWHIVAVCIATALVVACVWMKSRPPQVAVPPPPPPTVSDLVTNRVGPPDIYPRTDLNPGLANPEITQDNIAETICNKNWKTSSIKLRRASAIGWRRCMPSTSHLWWSCSKRRVRCATSGRRSRRRTRSVTNASVPWLSAGDVLADSWPVPGIRNAKTRASCPRPPRHLSRPLRRQVWRSPVSSVAGPWR